MQQNNQRLSLKDKITAHLPGHKHQDKNGNGIPDRMEKTTPRTLSDMNGNGIPDRLERGNLATAPLGTAPLGTVPIAAAPIGIAPLATVAPLGTAAYGSDLNRNGIPDHLERQGSYGTSTGFTDLNRNGIPDQLERQGSFGKAPTGFTDLNRNGIPDQLEGSQGFGFVGSVPAVQSSVIDVKEAPAIVEKIEKPAVVHEVYKTEEVVQIQPVIERERDQLDVYEVIQPMKEREVAPTEVRQAMLPAQTRATIVEDNSAFLAARSAPADFSTKDVMATRSQVVENAPIVHEKIVHKVIEEVQPVIYKEVDRPVLIKETLPIYEKIVEAPHAHKTVMPMKDLGTRTVTSTGFTDLNRDGIPDQLQGGMYQTTGLQSGLQSQGMYAARPGDLNGNGIPDQLERMGLQTGFPQNQGMYGARPGDLNGNGIPDSMEGRKTHRTLHDLNGNGIPDRMEKAHGLKDLNGNGIDDSLERRMGSATLNPTRTF